MTPTARIRMLLAELTWPEKLAQLQIVFRPGQDAAEQLVRDGIGSVFWPRSAAATNALQRVAVEETRLGIPVLVGLDVIHGTARSPRCRSRRRRASIDDSRRTSPGSPRPRRDRPA